MKGWKLLLSAFIFILALSFMQVETYAQSPGQLRALKQRGEKVTHMKNSFVVRVLKANNIPFTLTPKGAIASLMLDGKWSNVNRIEIVPIADESQKTLQVKGHEIFFYTDTQILHLVSSMIIH